MIWSELEFVVVESNGDECSNWRIALIVLSLGHNDDWITVEESFSLICFLIDCCERVDGMEILSVLLLGVGMGSTRSIWTFSFAGGDIGVDNSIWSWICLLSSRDFLNDDLDSIISFLRLWWWISDDRKWRELTSLCESKVELDVGRLDFFE